MTAYIRLVLLTSLLVAGCSGEASVDHEHIGQIQSAATLTDFVHAAAPHEPQLNPTWSRRPGRVLVIYTTFSDQPVPPDRGEAWLAQRVFGPGFPNAASYFAAASFSRMNVVPAAESGGVFNNGVVVVDAGPMAEYVTPFPRNPLEEDGPYADRINLWQNQTSLRLAEPFVNFGLMSGSTHTLSDWDVSIINVVDAYGGAVRGIAHTTADGTVIGGRMAQVGGREPLGILIHEAAHMLLGMPDIYGFPVGWFAIGGGPTVRAPEPALMLPNVWEKLHAGWVEPTVVTRDGYYTVPPADVSPTAFILHDPAKGADHYFTVENRRRAKDTYDNDIPDSGLVITRINETNYVHPFDASRPPIVTMWPRGGTTTPFGDVWAWDPTDPFTPWRDMTAPWGDGTASTVQVRAIRREGLDMIAYFDVPGPGILLDCYDGSAPLQISTVDFGLATSAEITIPIRNTGETADTFDFTIESLPPGWTATPEPSRTLASGEEARLNVIVTRPPGSDGVTARIRVAGRLRSRPDIGSSCEFGAKVPPLALFGYAWADLPSAPNYVPDLGHQYNSRGGTNRVQRLTTGIYRVFFPGLQVAKGGVAHVNAYGGSPNTCVISDYGDVPDVGEAVDVRCFNIDGLYQDSQFVVSFAKVWVAEPELAQFYEPTGTADYDTPTISFTTGEFNRVDRLSLGTYRVNLFGIGQNQPPHVQVTAKNWGPVRCQVSNVDYGGFVARVGVHCRDRLGGPEDSGFFFTAMNGVGPTGRRGPPLGYAYSPTPSASGYSLPSSPWQFDSAGGTVTGTNSSAGKFTLAFPGLGSTGGMVHVTSRDEGEQGFCNVRLWARDWLGSESIAVSCFSLDGSPKNQPFSVMHTR